MKKFIGTKQVSAEAMTLGEFIKKTGRNPYANDPELHGNNEKGYIVEYEDGYKSWSPKDVFEKAYKVAETHVDRMRIELKELRERMKKLQDFLLSEKSFEVKEDELYDLNCQYDLMNRYARTLLQRIRRAVKPKSEQSGIDLPTCDCPDCESPSM